MRRALLPISILLAIIAVWWLTTRKARPPKTVEQIIASAFDYRLAAPVEIVSRNSIFPTSFHGVWYSEDTVVRLSPADYLQLTTQAIASHHFQERDFAGHVVYDRELGKARISWVPDEEQRTVAYTYSEQ